MREHWPLLRTLRAALQNEPNVRLAVLFGSISTGHESERSDLDLLVVMGDQTARAVVALAQRLSDRLVATCSWCGCSAGGRASRALMADALMRGACSSIATWHGPG